MNNRYIVKINPEKMLCFYYDNGNIFVRELLADMSYSERGIIKDVRENYTVNLCKNGEIYLFCQNLNGDIIHLRKKGNDWNENVILKSNGKSNNNIIFYCLENGLQMSLVYNIPSNKKNCYDIMKQNFDGKGNWSKAEKIDTARAIDNFIFKLNLITNGYGILFYKQNKNSNENNIGYREINLNAIGEYNSIYSSTYRLGISSILPTNDAVHFLFTSKNFFSTKVLYKKKSINGMSNYITLGEFQQIDSCELFSVDNTLYAFWKTPSGFFYVTSSDNGETFSSPAKYTGKIPRNLEKAIYLTFVQSDKNHFNIENLYTDRINICNIQIIPEISQDFHLKQATPQKNPPKNTKTEMPQNIAMASVYNEKQNEKPEYTTDTSNTIERLKNQIALLNQQLSFKDKQIEKLISSINRKNEEFKNTEQMWRNRYKKSVTEQPKEQTEEKQIKLEKETIKAPNPSEINKLSEPSTSTNSPENS